MEWSIGQVAERAGVRSSALRYYESAGLLPRVPRRNGRRVYDASVFERLDLIQLAQHAGFTIAEIRTLLHGFSRRTPASRRWRTLAERKLVDVREQAARARSMERVLTRLLDCECPTLEDCGRALARHRDGGPG